MGRTKGITVINTAKKTVQGFEQMYAQLQQKWNSADFQPVPLTTSVNTPSGLLLQRLSTRRQAKKHAADRTGVCQALHASHLAAWLYAHTSLRNPEFAVAQSLVQSEHSSLTNLAKPLANHGA
jgi:hypothetical protein